MFIVPGGAAATMFCSQICRQRKHKGEWDNREQEDVFALQVQLALSHFSYSASALLRILSFSLHSGTAQLTSGEKNV